MSSIQEVQKMIHENAMNHGWWESEREFGTLIALWHFELSEALEEIRKGHGINETYYTDSGKMVGVPSELADVVIRVMDICEHYGINLESTILEKYEYNKNRPFKYGNRMF